MNKIHLAKQAKELYQIEHLNADAIAERLGISRRTVFNWMKQFEWKKLLPLPLQLYELQAAASIMLKDWGENHENYNSRQEKELFKFFDYVLKEEKKEAKRQKENPAPKGLTPERIRDIQRNILCMDV